jgi:DNA polymerase III delta subunit
MIKECALWLGKFPNLYTSDMDAWVEDVAKEHDLQPHDIVRLSVSSDTDISAWCNYELGNEDSWLSPLRIITIRGIEQLKAVQIAQLFDHLAAGESEDFIALTQANGAILKRVKDSLSEDVHDFAVPDKPDAAATWGKRWLKNLGVRVSQDALLRVAEHAGEDRGQFAAVIFALSTVEADHELDWNDVSLHCGNIGAVNVFEITNAITKGDKEAAVLAVRRFGGDHPLQLVKMLGNRYRGYLGLLGGKPEDSALLGISQNPYALKMMVKESKSLGEERAIRSLGIVLDAERGLKGGSDLSNEDLMIITVVKLANHFALRK